VREFIGKFLMNESGPRLREILTGDFFLCGFGPIGEAGVLDTKKPLAAGHNKIIF
jgi:hypothetical protein